MKKPVPSPWPVIVVVAVVELVSSGEVGSAGYQLDP